VPRHLEADPPRAPRVHEDLPRRSVLKQYADPLAVPPAGTEARERRSVEAIDLKHTADPLERLETWRSTVDGQLCASLGTVALV
jgi:hypothetical protein